MQSLPDVPFIQQIVIFITALGSALAAYVTWKRMVREDNRQKVETIANSPIANAPKWYLEGPIERVVKDLAEMKSLLYDLDEMKALLRKVNETSEKVSETVLEVQERILRLEKEVIRRKRLST